MLTKAIAALLLLLATACSNPNQDKLERGMAFAKGRFSEIGRNPIATAAFGSNVGSGGSLTSYLAASMPENADFPQFQDNQPVGPWSIALRLVGSDTVLIMGYGESTATPMKTDTVIITPPRM